MWSFLGKLALEIAPAIAGWFLGGKKDKSPMSQPMGSYTPYFEDYMNSLMGILHGNMPTAVAKMEERIKSQLQSEAGSLMNRTISALASRGVLRSGLGAMAGRDITAQMTSELADKLAGLEYGVYSQTMGAIPSLLNMGRQAELQAYGIRQANQQALWQGLASLSQALPVVFDYFFGKGGGSNG